MKLLCLGFSLGGGGLVSCCVGLLRVSRLDLNPPYTLCLDTVSKYKVQVRYGI